MKRQRQIMMGMFFALLCWTIPFGAVAENPTYPRADLLLEPAELAKNEVAQQFVILDARPSAVYAQAHVPSATMVPHDEWAKAFLREPDAKAWAKRIGGLGIGPKSKVVVYDDNRGKDAARIWWILRYWGAEEVRLLHGGWYGWRAGAFPVSQEPHVLMPVEFAPRPRGELLATKDEIISALLKNSTQIIDSRSEKEFCGIEKLGNRRAGAIPRAKHLEWSDLLDPASQRFKPEPALRRLFSESGIALDRPSVSHCQSGGRASVMVFALELMGARQVSNYYASWGEWGNADDTLVVPGKPKQKNHP